MKQFIKFLSITITVIAFLFLTANTAFAEKVTFVKEYNYNASDLDSKVSSRTIALEQVKRLLLEELGTYLISETEVKNFRLTKDQVTTYSAGVVSAEVVDEKWDGKTYYLKAKVSADPAEVTKSLQNIVNDKQKSRELEEVRKKASEFSKEIERLKKELEIAKANSKTPDQKADPKKIAQYNEAVKGLSATDWYKSGMVLFRAGKYQDAIAAFSQAIQLNHKITEAYNMRGFLYSIHRDYRKALKDFNYAIELDSTNVEAFVNRGFLYSMMKKYQMAIMNFDKAIEIDPTYAEAYHKRGGAYEMMGNRQQAFRDIESAMKLDEALTISLLKVSAVAGTKLAQDFLRAKGIEWME
ncbi:MAG: tetratricopeptide repeat protein [Thermodesulfovibrionales bacterium]|nr:tetratricopeptide repeat protein [Thermodesulfovibrionales bacterium]